MERILNISYQHKLSHIGSCLTTYPILKDIYQHKNSNDLVILSSGHAGLSQYVAIEEHSNHIINAEELLNKMGIHPERDTDAGIYVSSGSLGCAVLVAVGFALANKSRDVYCILSDGECAEGSVWEALRFCTQHKLTNFKPYVNCNGFSAYDKVDIDNLEERLKTFCPWIVICKTKNPEWKDGLIAHYYVMKDVSEIDKMLK